MTWLMLAVGLGLIAWGLWGSGAVSLEREPRYEAKPKQGPKQPLEREDAWRELVRPVEHDVDEKPAAAAPSRNTPFQKGLSAGVGAGLLIGAVLMANMGGAGDGAPQQQRETAQKEAPAAEPPLAETPLAETPPAETPPAPVVQEVIFVIDPGTPASVIAENLVTQGLVADGDAFLDRLASRGLETLLKAGDFTLNTGLTLDEVIDVLTS